MRQREGSDAAIGLPECELPNFRVKDGDSACCSEARTARRSAVPRSRIGHSGRVTMPSASEGERGDRPLVARFSAWVWDPNEWTRERGFPTAYLDVYMGELRAYPNALARFLRRKWNITYKWPTVVVEYVRPIGGPGVLVDVNGKLGRVAIVGRRRKAGVLGDALRAAGFLVVEVERRGWEQPQPVERAVLGDRSGDVPSCVVR
jgi:hypothetical protein